MRVELVKAGPEKYQNEGPFGSASSWWQQEEIAKKSSKEMVPQKLQNADRILRSWLLYSQLECGLYCFCCKLFGLGNDHSLFVAKTSITFWICLAWDWRSPWRFFSIDKIAKI